MPHHAASAEVWRQPAPTLEERALEIEDVERADRATRRRAWIRYGSEYLCWFLVSISMMFWAFHTTDSRHAESALWGGILVGDAGMLSVLVRLQLYSEKFGLR